MYELEGATQLQRHGAPVHNQARVVAADVKEEEGQQQAEGQLQEQKENAEEEEAEDAVENAAARATLHEILSALPLDQGARGGGGSGGDGGGGGGGDGSGSAGGDGCEDGAKSFAKDHLSTIAHLTHRRERQGLTLVHVSTQPEPFWSHHPLPPCLTGRGEIMHPTYPT